MCWLVDTKTKQTSFLQTRAKAGIDDVDYFYKTVFQVLKRSVFYFDSNFICFSIRCKNCSIETKQDQFGNRTQSHKRNYVKVKLKNNINYTY